MMTERASGWTSIRTACSSQAFPGWAGGTASAASNSPGRTGQNKQVTLTAGEEYLIAFTHREGGGGSRADFAFTGPAGSAVTTETVVKPADGAQAGFWSTFTGEANNDVIKTGSGTTTLSASNTYKRHNDY